MQHADVESVALNHYADLLMERYTLDCTERERHQEIRYQLTILEQVLIHAFKNRPGHGYRDMLTYAEGQLKQQAEKLIRDRLEGQIRHEHARRARLTIEAWDDVKHG